MKFLLALTFLAAALIADTKDARAAERPRGYAHVVEKLVDRGVDRKFAEKIADRSESWRQERIIRTNVFGFRLKADYSGHITDGSIKKCKQFKNRHADILKKAEKEYNVPASAIAALLWIETRHGQNLGHFKVYNAYMDLAMSDHPFMVERSLKWLSEETPDTDPEHAVLTELVRARSEAKAAWAIDQLVALHEIHQRKLLNVFKLVGSYAGAFGISQFIPTSYLKWATDGNNDRRVDLFQVEDSIASTANYLRLHGWDIYEMSQKAALFHYNRSRDYGATILELASRIGS